jgi:hypothetical protein
VQDVATWFDYVVIKTQIKMLQHGLTLLLKRDNSGRMATGLPDFSLYKIPKRGKNIPNYHGLYQMSIKYDKRP